MPMMSTIDLLLVLCAAIQLSALVFMGFTAYGLMKSGRIAYAKLGILISASRTAASRVLGLTSAVTARLDRTTNYLITTSSRVWNRWLQARRLVNEVVGPARQVAVTAVTVGTSVRSAADLFRRVRKLRRTTAEAIRAARRGNSSA